MSDIAHVPSSLPNARLTVMILGIPHSAVKRVEACSKAVDRLDRNHFYQPTPDETLGVHQLRTLRAFPWNALVLERHGPNEFYSMFVAICLRAFTL